MKHYYLIVDVETSATNQVLDLGAVVVDRNGKKFAQLGALVKENINQDFHWALGSPFEIKKKYKALLDANLRSIQSVNQINLWLKKIKEKYDPVLTAYNIGFDMSKCRATGIYLDLFDQRFCLWGASKATICKTPEYISFIEENMFFTQGGQISTKADYVARFIDQDLPPEPHTALEDARDYESVILYAIISRPETRKAILEKGAGKLSAKWMQSLEDLK